MNGQPGFEVVVPSDEQLGETLIIGVSTPGMVGLSTVDYLLTHLETEQIGHMRTQNVPDITPFENGEPRFPTRLYTAADPDLTVLISELFVPVWAADPFVDALVEWSALDQFEDITMLHGVPYPHSHDEHNVCHVATSAYREKRLADADIPPLGGGVLDGIPSELVTRGLEGAVPPVGVFVTPSHPPGPDFDSALRFLNALQHVYDFDVDADELLELSAEMKRYYAELADRTESIRSQDQSFGSPDYPEDRMYM